MHLRSFLEIIVRYQSPRPMFILSDRLKSDESDKVVATYYKWSPSPSFDILEHPNNFHPTIHLQKYRAQVMARPHTPPMPVAPFCKGRVPLSFPLPLASGFILSSSCHPADTGLGTGFLLPALPPDTSTLPGRSITTWSTSRCRTWPQSTTW